MSRSAAAGRVTQEMQEESLGSAAHRSSTQVSALPSASLCSVGIPAQPRALLSSVSAMNVPVDSSFGVRKTIGRGRLAADGLHYLHQRCHGSAALKCAQAQGHDVDCARRKFIAPAMEPLEVSFVSELPYMRVPMIL